MALGQVREASPTSFSPQDGQVFRQEKCGGAVETPESGNWGKRKGEEHNS